MKILIASAINRGTKVEFKAETEEHIYIESHSGSERVCVVRLIFGGKKYCTISSIKHDIRSLYGHWPGYREVEDDVIIKALNTKNS